jgi:hypothetical protein
MDRARPGISSDTCTAAARACPQQPVGALGIVPAPSWPVTAHRSQPVDRGHLAVLKQLRRAGLNPTVIDVRRNQPRR